MNQDGVTIDSYFNKVFIINLKKNVNRKELMIKKLEKKI